MEWMWNAMWAWFGWNVLAPLAVVVAFLVTVFASSIPSMLRQARCKHINYSETRSCDAICTECGANLGFAKPIGLLGTRRQQAKASIRRAVNPKQD